MDPFTYKIDIGFSNRCYLQRQGIIVNIQQILGIATCWAIDIRKALDHVTPFFRGTGITGQQFDEVTLEKLVLDHRDNRLKCADDES